VDLWIFNVSVNSWYCHLYYYMSCMYEI